MSIRCIPHLPMCPAQRYVVSARSSNECPDGAFRITTDSTCDSAVTALGLSDSEPSEVYSDRLPKGCSVKFEVSSGDLNGNVQTYFNTHSSGSGATAQALICRQGAFVLRVFGCSPLYNYLLCAIQCPARR